MPQTRFVLQKAIEMGKKPVLVINKVDKLNCRPDEVQEEVFDLVIADVPCSGTGVIARKPDIKYNMNEESQKELIIMILWDF